MCVNITLAVDETTVERAREIARQQGTSLNSLIREYIELLANQVTGNELLKEFEQMWTEVDGAGSGARRPYKFDREDIYEERLARYKGKRG